MRFRYIIKKPDGKSFMIPLMVVFTGAGMLGQTLTDLTSMKSAKQAGALLFTRIDAVPVMDVFGGDGLTPQARSPLRDA